MLDYLGGLGGEIAREQTFSSMMTFTSSRGLRLVQVHAVDGGFPFYGRFETEPAEADLLLRNGGPVVVIEPTLLSQFNARVGDKVKLGRTDFTIIGSLKKVPGESPGVAMMAPRAYIPMGTLAGTGLSSTGHRFISRSAG